MEVSLIFYFIGKFSQNPIDAELQRHGKMVFLQICASRESLQANEILCFKLIKLIIVPF